MPDLGELIRSLFTRKEPKGGIGSSADQVSRMAPQPEEGPFPSAGYSPAPGYIPPAEYSPAPYAGGKEDIPWGQVLYLDRGTLDTTVQPGYGPQANPPLFWEPRSNVLTLSDTGNKAMYGVNAPYEPQLQQVLDAERLRREVVAGHEEEMKTLSDQKLQHIPPPETSRLAEVEILGIPQPTDAQTGTFQAPSKIDEETISKYDELVVKVSEIVTSPDYHTEQGQRQLVQLLQEEQGLAPWLVNKEPELVAILSRLGVPMDVELETGRGAPFLERKEGTFVESLVRGVFQGPLARGRDPAGGMSDEQINAWFGGNFFEGMTRVFRAGIEDMSEASPFADLVFSTVPVVWDILGDVVKGILPGARGSITSEHMAARNRGPGIYDIIRYLPLGELATPAIDIAAALSGEPYESFSAVKIFGLPLNEFLVVETPERVAEKQANIDRFRGAVDRVFNRDIVSTLDMAQGWDQLSAETQRRILGDKLYTDLQARADLNSNLARVMEIQDENIAAQSAVLHALRGSLSPEAIEMVGEGLVQSCTDYWYAKKARTDVPSFAFRFTWKWSSQGEELEAQADQAIIMAMAQKGRPLENWEIEEVTRRFVEFGPELAGEAIFDPLNLIPGEVISRAFKGIVGIPGKITKAVAPKLYSEVIRTFRTGAVASVANRFGNAYNDVAILVAHKTGDDMIAFDQGMRFIIDNADNPAAWSEITQRYGVLGRSLRQLRQAFEAVSPDDFNKILASAKAQVDNVGRELTPRNVADELGESVSRAYRTGRRMTELGRLGAYDEGMLYRLFEKGAEGEIKHPGALQNVARMYIQFQRTFRGAWTPLVLTWRPAYTVINHLDNAFRTAVYGTDLTLNFDTVLERVRPFAGDDVLGGYGHAYEFGGHPQVAQMLMDGTLEPDLFKVWKWGWENAPVGELKKGYQPFARWGSAFGAVNSASEAMFRIRLYDNLRRQNLRLVLPIIDEAINTQLAGQPEEVQAIIRQGLLQFSDNPGKLNAYLKGEVGVWSVLVPENVYNRIQDVYGDMAARDFVHRVVGRFQDLIDKGQFSVGNADAIIDDILEEGKHLYDETTETARGMRPAGEGIAQPERALEGLETSEDAMRAGRPSRTFAERVRERLKEVDTAPFISEEDIATMEDAAKAELRGDVAEIVKGKDMFADDVDFARTINRAQQFHKIKGNQMAQSTRELGDALRAMRGDEVMRAAHQDAIDTVATYIETFDALMRGELRRFALYSPTGPVTLTEMGMPGGLAWEQYFTMVDQAYDYFIALNKEMLDLMGSDEGLAELSKMWNKGQPILPSRSEILGREGVGYYVWFDPERGTPIAYQWQPSGQAPKRGEWNTLEMSDFAQTFGFSSQEEWLETPYNISHADIMQERKVQLIEEYGTVQRTVDNMREVAVRGEIWQTVLEGSFDDLSRARAAFTAIVGDDVIDQPDNFFSALNSAIEKAEEVGDLMRARMLRRQYLSVQAELNMMLVAEGLTEVQIPGPIRTQWLSDGIRSEYAAANRAIVAYDSLVMNMENWRTYLTQAITDDAWYVRNLAPDVRNSLRRTADSVSDVVANGLSTVHNGGQIGDLVVEGAARRVNDIMIDYRTFGTFDRFMKENISQFWMFPSRSLPMWIDTMARKPWLATLYHKYLRGSEHMAWERGAVDRRGNPLPSLRGYFPIPYTDKWVNPTAPLSIRYAIPDLKKFRQPDDTEEAPTRLLGRLLVDWTRPFGLFPNPWVMAALYRMDAVSEFDIPPFAIVPQINLIPPFAQHAAKRFLIRLSNGHLAHEGNDMLTPWVAWKDYLIEYRILANALEQCLRPDISEEQCQVLAEKARAATDSQARGANPEVMELWEIAKGQIETSDYFKSLLGYFTGFYFKEFTTAKAEFTTMRMGIANVRQALNNEARAAIFDMPADVLTRKEHYTEARYNSPEGLLEQTYLDISFVTTEEGEPAYGADRAEIITQVLHEEEVTQAYFDARKKEFDDFDSCQRALPTGASSEAEGACYDNLYDALAEIDSNEMYRDRKISDYIGYAPEKLVYNELVDVIWRAFRDSIPRWDPDAESYMAYEKRKDAYIEKLPNIAPHIIRAYYQAFISKEKLEGPVFEAAEKELRVLIAPEVNMPIELWERLLTEFSSPANYEGWMKSRDSEWEALSWAWEEMFWRPHWEAVTDPQTGEILRGDGFRLAQGRFIEQFPDGRPSDEQLVQKVQEAYPGRWSNEDLMIVLRGNETYSVEDRQGEMKGDAFLEEQRLWDLIWRVDPGSQYGEFIDMVEVMGKEFGIDKGDLDTFTNTGGSSESFTDQEKWQNLLMVVSKAVVAMGLPEPGETEMEERIAVRELNDEFNRLRNERFGSDWNTLNTYYYSLNREEKMDFREDSPEVYARLQGGWAMKDEFAVANPIWAKYYHSEVYQAMKEGKTLEEAIAGLESDGTLSRGAGGRGYARGGAGGRGRGTPPRLLGAGLRGAETGIELVGRGLGRGGITASPYWPPWVLDTIGTTAAQEVENAAKAGEPIPELTSSYIKKLDANEPRNLEEEVKDVYARMKSKKR